MKAVRPVIASKAVPYLQMRSVGSHSTSGREKEGMERRTGSTLHFTEHVVTHCIYIAKLMCMLKDKALKYEYNHLSRRDYTLSVKHLYVLKISI